MRSLFDRWTLLILHGAGLFMLRGAGRYTVFDDEAFSCRRYAMPLGEMVSALWHGAEPDPPLYYVLENLWVGLFGVGPLGLRSLSIFMFLAGLVFIRAAGQAWFDRRTGLAAMVLCALHPAHLFFGFAARWYSLMFLCTAIVLWLTARMCKAGPYDLTPSAERESTGEATADRPGIFLLLFPPSWRWSERRLILGWSVAAAAACYTNYFGPVFCAFALLAGALHGRKRPGNGRTWALAAAGAVILCIPWLAPLLRQAFNFPVAEFTWTAVGASLARTVMALLAGNLASVEDSWAWIPLGVFSAAMVVLLLFRWRAVRPIAVIVLGCAVIGVASRTMIDKYIMTFSGPACLLVVALLRRPADVGVDRPSESQPEDERISRPRRLTIRLWSAVALACLAAGWVKCGINLFTEKHWSSLRWLDPFEGVIDDLFATPDAPPTTRWVMTHPSARYYFGRRFAREQAAAIGAAPWRISARHWRRFAEPPTPALGNFGVACATPDSILGRMKETPVPLLITVETTGYRELADNWGELLSVLDQFFQETSRHPYLPDRDAALKDRLDPAIAHARWRIVVRWWAFGAEKSPTSAPG